MSAHASIRISLRWLPDPPFETTHTLALNCGAYYVDLRTVIADGSIEWGMAGERLILNEDPLKCRWLKTIDSTGSTAPDEGVFETLPNGDDLERGCMPCEEKGGAMTDYEEVWRSGPLATAAGGGSWVLRSVEDGGKTWLGRVGGYYLAMQQGEKDGKTIFAAVREEWDGEEGTEWVRKYEGGDADVKVLPSLVGRDGKGFEGEGKWKVGQIVEIVGTVGIKFEVMGYGS